MIPNEFSEFYQLLKAERAVETFARYLLEPDKQLALTQFNQTTSTSLSIALQMINKTYDVEAIGGKNSRNFKVTDPRTGTRFVIKLEMGTRPDYLQELNTEIILKPNYTTRLNINRFASFILIDYLEAGDLNTLAQNTSEDKLELALTMYSQMANFFDFLDKNNCLMMDAKNSNFLYDNVSKQIRVADIKSFFETVNGYYSDSDRVFTHSYFHNIGDEIDGSALHSYILGKNLYKFLTGCASRELLNKHEGSSFDFSNEIFNSERGQRLKALIIGLVKDNPRFRTTIYTALHELEYLKTKNLNNIIEDCQQLRQHIPNSNIIISENMDIDRALIVERELRTKFFDIINQNLSQQGVIEPVGDINSIKQLHKKLLTNLKDKIIKFKNFNIHLNDAFKNEYRSLVTQYNSMISIHNGSLIAAKESLFSQVDAYRQSIQSINSIQIDTTTLKDKIDKQLLSIQTKAMGKMFEGDNGDSMMDSYINNKRRELTTCESWSDYQLLSTDLINTERRLDAPEYRALKNTAFEYYEKSKKTFSRGGHLEKAKGIANALRNINISERDSAHEKTAIKQALARPRFLGIENKNTTKNFKDKIDRLSKVPHPEPFTPTRK